MLEKWKLLEGNDILNKYEEKYNSFYYTRDIAGYNAHIFLVFFDKQQELEKEWEWIEEYVAFHYQSEVEKDIELSNFYICYFIKEDVDIHLQSMIEQGTYCAKKYVFRRNSMSRDEACAMLESKLFHLDIGYNPSKEDKKQKIKGITIKYFRKYANQAPFVLTDKNNDPASFVLVYAPNGMGKTSFTDAVEYALKGKVDRLVKLANLTDAKGMIYHNKYHTEKGYVQLDLEDGAIVRRSVGNISKKRNNDIRAVSASKGKDITGDSEVSDRWNQIILPHDSVDSFLTANSPEERFVEWFDYAPNLKEERDDFEKKRKKYRELLRKLDEVKNGNKEHKGIEWLQKKVQDLEGKVENVNRFREQVTLYNSLVEDASERIELPQGDMSMEDYHNISSEITVQKAALIKKIKELEETEERIGSIQFYGPEQAKSRYEYLHQIREEQAELEKKQSSVLKMKSLKEQITALSAEFSDEEKKSSWEELLVQCKEQLQVQTELLPKMFGTLKELKKEMETVENDIAHLVGKKETDDGFLGEINKLVTSYLVQHDKVCKCPVCNSEFSSWNELIGRINQYNENEEIHFQEKLETYQVKKQKLSEEIAEISERHNTVAFEVDILEKRKSKLENLISLQDVIRIQAAETPKEYHEILMKERLYEIAMIFAQEKETPIWEYYDSFRGMNMEELSQLRMDTMSKRMSFEERLMRLSNISLDEGMKAYVDSYRSYKKELKHLLTEEQNLEKNIAEMLESVMASKEVLQESLRTYFGQNTINRIYQKLDPHEIMKNVRYEIDFEKEKPELYIYMNSNSDEHISEEGYQPELFFSTAQLNTVAFSSFFGRALERHDLPIGTIFIDDPIDNFDDMNMLGFADLIRSIIESTDCQIVMTTHDPKVLGIMQRKLDPAYHSSRFIEL